MKRNLTRVCASILLFLLLAAVVLGLTGCSTAGRYAMKNRADVGIDLVVHVHSERYTRAFVIDQVFMANRVLKHHGLRVLNVHLVEDLGPNLTFATSEYFGGHAGMVTKDITNDRRGLHVYVVDELSYDSTVVGLSIIDAMHPCLRVVVLEHEMKDKDGPHTHRTTLAHELGHTFGLKHVLDDKTNIMKPGNRVMWSSLTTQQYHTLKYNAARWKRTCVK